MSQAFQVDTAGTLMTSLYSYKKTDADATDFFNSNLDGTSANMSYASAGIISNGATFNGSSSKITLSSANDTNAFTTVSFNFWMKSSDSSDEVIYYAADAGGVNIMYFRKSLTTAHKLDFITAHSPDPDRICTTTTSVDSGAWIMITATRNGANAAIYVNGNTTAEATSSSFETANIGTTRTWGVFKLLDIFWYTGMTDEMGIWTKVLSSQEITDLYNSGAGNTLQTVTTAIKTWDGLANASTKTFNGLARASVKTRNGLA